MKILLIYYITQNNPMQGAEARDLTKSSDIYVDYLELYSYFHIIHIILACKYKMYQTKPWM